MKIAFIGGGVMGEAMIKGILDRGVASNREVCVSDVSEARRNSLSRSYSILALADNRQAVQEAEVVILAIKPQNLSEVMSELKGHLLPNQVVISIIAGARLATLELGLSHNILVRAMPNTPAQIGRGITVWTSTEKVNREQRGLVASILAATGKEVYVAEEKYLDMATAVSGSGPAYIFLIIESLVDAAVHIGLPRQLAQELVMETLTGSACLVRETGRHPAELRNMVTSPGGTTAEGLFQLEQGKLRALIQQAVLAAYNKAKLLGSSDR